MMNRKIKPTRNTQISSKNNNNNVPSPFLIPTIFESFIKHLPYYDLQLYKTVCKEWYLMITQHLYQLEGQLFFTTDQNSEERIQNELKKWLPLKYNEVITFGYFQPDNLLQLLKHKKFTNISTLHIYSHKISKENLQQMLTSLESSLRVFKLKTNSYYNSCVNFFQMYNKVDMKNGKSEKVIKQYPNIKVLEFTDWLVNPSTTIQEVAKTFPELCELHFNTKHKNESSKAKEFIQLTKLRHLSIKYENYHSNEVSRIFSNSFSKMKLKLSHLELINICPRFQGQEIMKLLITQKNTLKSLRLIICDTTEEVLIKNKPSDNMPAIVIPVLPKLKKLDISEHFIVKNLMSTVTFSGPNVTVLSFHKVQRFGCLIPTMEKCRPHLNIKEISFTSISSQELSSFSKWLPNLNKLSLSICGDELLQIIFMNFKRIKTLHIGSSGMYNKFVTDKGILGIGTDSVFDVRNLVLREEWKSRHDLVNVGMLKDLEELQIDTWPGGIKKYTWRSLVFGIAQLPKLKLVTLPNVNVNQTSSGRIVKEFERNGFKYVHGQIPNYFTNNIFNKYIMADVFLKE